MTVDASSAESGLNTITVVPDNRAEAHGAGVQPLHVVAIGASAGGLEALEIFFNTMPPSDKLAFVVIQHLSPDFRSLMDEILARQTKLNIFRVEDAMLIQPGSIYLIPPKKEMTIQHGRLFLSDKDAFRPLEMPIDIFFRSLAQDAGERGIGIILSGTGSDGSRGIMDVHDAKGLVLVQNPETAKFDGMPRSAIESGCVNYVLPPDEMPAIILQYLENPESCRQANQQAEDAQQLDAESVLALDLLKRQYGIDFTFYKPTTIGRRIARRMALSQIGRMSDYLDFLSTNADELSELSKDMLIGVTSFFRDPDAFQKLELEIIPSIFANLQPQDEFRAWVAGCATGEEVYSLAMLVFEEAERRNFRGKITLFATDVHRESLDYASAGLYELSRLSGLSSHRISRFFREENGNQFRICPELRGLVVFAQHNVLSDPPFTKMDFVSCRNMLIYFLPMAQDKAISLFHFALKQNAVLFLGSSESPGALGHEFETLDGKYKFFSKRRDVRLNIDLKLNSPERPKTSPQFMRSMASMDRTLLRDYELLLRRHLPDGLIVGERREVLHYLGNGARYLTKMTGRAERDVLDMVEGDLKLALGAALLRSASENTRIQFHHVECPLGNGVEYIDLAVECLSDDKLIQRHFHVSFVPQSTDLEEVIEISQDDTLMTSDAAWHRIVDLESELQTTKENLQATIEELQTTNEELQATNEELLAANEELQSTNEELHSVNEELYTVNAEFEKKNKELRDLNDDHDNLLRSTEVGTLFLDMNLCIRKFNPAIESSFKLLPQDIGRPVDHIAYQLEGQTEMLQELRQVLVSGEILEREIQSTSGNWLLRRILPFRNSTGGIKGVVLTFTDITTVKEAEQERHGARLVRELASNVPGMVFQFAAPMHGVSKFTFVSDSARFVLGDRLAAQVAASSRMSEMVYEEDVARFEAAMDLATTSFGILDCEHRVELDSGEIRWIQTRGTPRIAPDGEISWNGVSIDITERKVAESRAVLAADFHLRILNRAPALIWRAGRDAKCDWFNETWLNFTGRHMNQEIGDGWAESVHPEDLRHCLETYQDAFYARSFFEMEYRMRRHDGAYRWILDFGCPFEDLDGKFGGYIGYCYDITDRKQIAADLENAKNKAEEANRSKSEFLANMSHEIRTPLNGVMGMLQLMQTTALNAEQKEYAQTAFQSCERLTGLLGDILDLSKVEAGKLTIQRESFCLPECIQQVNELFYPMAKQTGVALRINIDPDIPNRVLGDSTRLQQVLNNLVGNAFKFTHKGQISINATLIPEKKPNSQRVLFSVADTGIGIPDDKIDILFKPFSQVSVGFTRKYQGAGLGLSICKHLVELMHGNISIESEVGMGTTIHFCAEFGRDNRKRHRPTITRKQGEVVLSQLRILLAEDDRVSCLALERQLQKAGCTVICVENGAKALDALKKDEFDVVFMDVQMPDVDGLEAATAIRNGKLGDNKKSIPIIAMTAYAMDGDRERFLSAGMDDYISKPIDMGQIKYALKRVLFE